MLVLIIRDLERNLKMNYAIKRSVCMARILIFMFLALISLIILLRNSIILLKDTINFNLLLEKDLLFQMNLVTFMKKIRGIKKKKKLLMMFYI